MYDPSIVPYSKPSGGRSICKRRKARIFTVVHNPFHGYAKLVSERVDQSSMIKKWVTALVFEF